jgi:hypothetical protein
VGWSSTCFEKIWIGWIAIAMATESREPLCAARISTPRFDHCHKQGSFAFAGVSKLTVTFNILERLPEMMCDGNNVFEIIARDAMRELLSPFHGRTIDDRLRADVMAVLGNAQGLPREDGSLRWYRDCRLHRDGAPAVMWADGGEDWYMRDRDITSEVNRWMLDNDAEDWQRWDTGQKFLYKLWSRKFN